MTNIQSIFSTMESIYQDCGSLMKSAEKMAASSDPKQRALAYEIGVAVSKIMGEQKVIVAELVEISGEIGAMAE